MPLATNEKEIFLKTATSALQNCQQEIPALVSSVRITPESIILRTSPSKLRALALYVRNNSLLQFRTLVDIAVVDKLLPAGRFAVNYSFLSMVTNQRLTVQLYAAETTTVPSLAAPFVNAQRLFASASWLEREVWDMYGLYFSDHGDLRRILTDYGFTGHPLRKDFPLTGFHELVYNDAEGRVTSEPVELAQEFRVFHL
jgi:NADH:ubiquinone oxidoreductase subunit C